MVKVKVVSLCSINQYFRDAFLNVYEPDEMGRTYGQNERRVITEELIQRNKEVAENEEEHR